MIKSAKLCALAALACVMLAGCQARDVSGIYSASDADSVALIQLIETKDHKLSGRFEAHQIQNDGSLSDNVMIVDGAESDGDLTIILMPSWAKAGVSFTGHIDNGKLTLVGHGKSMNLVRGTLKDYQAAQDKLGEKAGKIKAEQQRLATIATEQAKIESDRQAQNRANIAAENRFGDLIDNISAIDKKAGDFITKLTEVIENMKANKPRIPTHSVEIATLLESARSAPRGFVEGKGNPREDMWHIMQKENNFAQNVLAFKLQAAAAKRNLAVEINSGIELCNTRISEAPNQIARSAADGVCARLKGDQNKIDKVKQDLDFSIDDIVSDIRAALPKQQKMLDEARSFCFTLKNC